MPKWEPKLRATRALWRTVPSGEFLIWDTEFTAWDGSHQRGWSETWEHREIVQLAAMRIRHDIKDATLHVEKTICEYVKPAKNGTLSEYFMNLTKITQADVDERGITLEECAKKLFDISRTADGRVMPILSWGSDEEVLLENLALQGLVLPGQDEVLAQATDVRPIFEAFGIDPSRYSSGTVHKSVGIVPKVSGGMHNALWDIDSIRCALEHFLKGGQVAQEQATAWERDVPDDNANDFSKQKSSGGGDEACLEGQTAKKQKIGTTPFQIEQ